MGLVPCLLVVTACEPGAPSLEEIRARQNRGEIDETVEPLRRYLAEHPGDGEASYLYGRALVATGQLSLATWPLRQAMQDPRWLAPAGLQLAHATLASSDFNETVEATSAILEQQPDNHMARLLRAQANAHWRSDPEMALSDAERVLEENPAMLEAYEPRILALLTLERHEEARAALAEVGERLEEVDAAESTLAWHCSTEAIFTFESGRVEEARAAWDRCLERHPADPTVVSNAVQYFDAVRDYARGLVILQSAFETAPDPELFRAGLAARLAALGRAEEGRALLAEAGEVDDPILAARALGDLALFHHGLGEHGAAADALARAIELIEPVEAPSQQLLFQYADALVASDRLDRAREVAGRLAVPAQRRLIEARVAQERGEFEAAMEAFDEALRLWPDNASARYYAARTAEVLGDFDRALEEYRYAIRIAAGATDARTRAAKLLLAQRQPMLAYQLLFLEVESAPLDPDGEVLAMYLLARVANPSQLQTALLELASRDPARLPEALASGAAGAAELAGPAAALQLLGGMPGMNYAHPGAGPALRAFVGLAHAAGRSELAGRMVEDALAADPEASVFHALRAEHRRLSGESPDRVREAYQQALALDPENPHALAGLAALLEEQDPEEALRLYDAAAEADPEEPAHRLAAARLLASTDRAAPARERLDALLVEFPLLGEAAGLRADLDLETGRVSEASLEAARRAARFEPGPESLERLDRVRTALDRA